MQKPTTPIIFRFARQKTQKEEDRSSSLICLVKSIAKKTKLDRIITMF